MSLNDYYLSNHILQALNLQFTEKGLTHLLEIRMLMLDQITAHKNQLKIAQRSILPKLSSTALAIKNRLQSTPVNRTRFLSVNNVRLARLSDKWISLVCGWLCRYVNHATPICTCVALVRAGNSLETITCNTELFFTNPHHFLPVPRNRHCN